ncbi:MAG: HAMP domain-containing histidine kinase [Sphingobacteriales bacterium]|nr:MAG: HAMP domain-containing histidine kinase [Sphingobacteriales bacterium]
MKRVFPLIVVLITLSVLGIIFIQMSWIKNAIDLRRQQHEQAIQDALHDIKEGFYDRFAVKTGVVFDDENSRMHYMGKFSVNMLTQAEVDQIVEQNIRKNKIRNKFEYEIIDVYRTPIRASDGFKYEHIPNSHKLSVSTENSAFYNEVLLLYFFEDNNYVIRQLSWVIAASMIFTVIIISAFGLTVRTMFTQKKLSEIKSDFINNMTHELKTPLATISLAIDALTNEKVIHDTDKIRYYSSMIKDENKRMNKQVEKILQAARIERQEIKLNLQDLNAHEIIRKISENLDLQIQDKDGALTLKLAAQKHRVFADEVHFSNIIFNLLDNAIKYSKDAPRIEVQTLQQGGMLAIKVKDNGIGMNKETQSRVFEKFYRAHTGNLHNVKGFGLGLSYVKAMVEAHGGKIKVESAVGKGSTFTCFFPLSETRTD